MNPTCLFSKSLSLLCDKAPMSSFTQYYVCVILILTRGGKRQVWRHKSVGAGGIARTMHHLDSTAPRVLAVNPKHRPNLCGRHEPLLSSLRQQLPRKVRRARSEIHSEGAHPRRSRILHQRRDRLRGFREVVSIFAPLARQVQRQGGDGK